MNQNIKLVGFQNAKYLREAQRKKSKSKSPQKQTETAENQSAAKALFGKAAAQKFKSMVADQSQALKSDENPVQTSKLPVKEVPLF